MFGVCLIGPQHGNNASGLLALPVGLLVRAEYAQPAYISASRIWGCPVVFRFALFLVLSVQAGNVSADRILSKILWASYESHWDLFHYTKATPTNTFVISPLLLLP